MEPKESKKGTEEEQETEEGKEKQNFSVPPAILLLGIGIVLVIVIQIGTVFWIKDYKTTMTSKIENIEKVLAGGTDGKLPDFTGAIAEIESFMNKIKTLDVSTAIGLQEAQDAVHNLTTSINKAKPSSADSNTTAIISQHTDEFAKGEGKAYKLTFKKPAPKAKNVPEQEGQSYQLMFKKPAPQTEP